jgi:hypothetical protein
LPSCTTQAEGFLKTTRKRQSGHDKRQSKVTLSRKTDLGYLYGNVFPLTTFAAYTWYGTGVAGGDDRGNARMKEVSNLMIFGTNVSDKIAYMAFDTLSGKGTPASKSHEALNKVLGPQAARRLERLQKLGR